jgi:hypothetical protein
MSAQNNPNLTQSHNARRVKFALNVVIAVVAALLLTVLANWIAYRQFVRFDLTATRQYSLSQQTQQLLAGIKEPHKIVTLLPPGSLPEIDRTRDLVDEYARYGKGKITVEHLEAGRGVSKLEAFYITLRERFAKPLKEIDGAVSAGRSLSKKLRDQSKDQVRLATELGKLPALGEGDAKTLINSVAQALSRWSQQLETLETQIDKANKDPLPDYAVMRDTLRQTLRDLDDKVYAVAVNRLERIAQATDTPAPVKEQTLALVELLKASRRDAAPVLDALRDAVVPEDYEKVRGQLDRSANAVVVLGPAKIQVLSLEQMFRETAEAAAVAAGAPKPELQFLGEELITGALLTMTLENPPMIVFVTTGRRPALGQQGEYQQVAQRLTNMNFKVEEWNPAGRPGPMGQPVPGGPPPEPKPGQKAVWIVPPGEPANPMMGAPDMRAPAIEKVRERLAAGDSLLLMPVFNPMSMFSGAPDPTASLLEGLGISAQTDRIVMREETLPRGQTRATRQLTVSRWPTDNPITKVLGGAQAIFVLSSPLVLGEAKDKDVKTWPLAEITGKGLWAERNNAMQEERAKRDPATAGEKFLIAAAAEKKGGSRVVVVADPAWASDQIVSYGLFGQGTAELSGAVFPGNAELFVNSIYWLSGMEQYIAASARTQDIRRVRSIDPDRREMLLYALLLGMPAAAFFAGGVVWFIRRRA